MEEEVIYASIAFVLCFVCISFIIISQLTSLFGKYLCSILFKLIILSFLTIILIISWNIMSKKIQTDYILEINIENIPQKTISTVINICENIPYCKRNYYNYFIDPNL